MSSAEAAESESPSRTGFLLREFAKVVAVEERDLSNSTDRLIQAANEVAFERGLVSPLRSRKSSPRFDTEDEGGNSDANPHMTGRNGTVSFDTDSFRRPIKDSEDSNRDQSDETATALMAAMGVAPNNAPSKTRTMPGLKKGQGTDEEDFDDDVDALIQSKRRADKAPRERNRDRERDAGRDRERSKERGRSQPPYRPNAGHTQTHASQDLQKRNNSRDNARYQQRMTQAARDLDADKSDNDRDETTRTRDSRPSNSRLQRKKLSAVAAHLNKSEELISNNRKAPSQSLFTSTAQEILFRKMHSHSHTAAGGVPGKKKEDTDSRSEEKGSADRERERDRGRDREREREKGGHNNHIRAIVDRLTAKNQTRPSAAEVKRDPTLRYTRYEDAKECTFRPQINGQKKDSQGNNDRDDEEEREREQESKNAFIERQEAQERTRRVELDQAIGKAAYDKLIDKKQCPVCTAKQSYDEVKEKRKECPNCRVEYKRTTTWGEIGNQFFTREKINAMKKTANKEQIKQEILDEINTKEKLVYDREKGKKVLIREKIDLNPILTTAESEREFHERTKLKMSEKENRLRLLEAESLAQTCTFQPKIKKKIRRRGSDDEDSDEETKDPATSFMSRMESDWHERRRNKPEKFITNDEILDRIELAKSYEAFK